jgi:hypothetical protein
LNRALARALLAAALLPACAPARQAVQPAPAARDTALKPAPLPLPVPDPYRAALRQGTRSADGRPGPRYWQQRVRYDIHAELDPATAALTGTERIVYLNRSPDTMRVVTMNVYQNLFAPPSVPADSRLNTGGMTLTRFVLQGQPLPALTPAEWSQAVHGAAPRGGYSVAGTMAGVSFPRPLAPGDSAVFEIDWRYKVPPAGAPRTGWEDALGGRVFQVAQWYPQIAVNDDVAGVDATPYTGSGEFYLEYGDFDVALTLPTGWIVGATGTLLNPEQVLSAQTRSRLAAAMASDSTTAVVTETDLSAHAATQPGTAGRLTWRYHASDVRDVAFATSDRYLWDATRASIPDAQGGAHYVPVHSLYRRGAPGWGRGARYGQHALGYFSRLMIPYIYPQVTVTEGPEYGMEYPMLVFIGRPAAARELQSVIAHEVGHEWFPMMVGADEAAFAWMDEGINTYDEARAVEDFFPGSDPWMEDRTAYLGIAGRKTEAPMMKHIDQVGEPASGISAYFKPGTVLRSLNAVVGDSVFRLAMKTYASEWLLKHPYPWDFFHTFERVSGRDLDWFFEPWWFRTATLNQAIENVHASPGGVTVTVRDLGGAPAPTPIVVTTADGRTAATTIPGERWSVERLRTVTVDVPIRGRVVKVEIDPDRLFPDVDRANNVWTVPGGA